MKLEFKINSKLVVTKLAITRQYRVQAYQEVTIRKKRIYLHTHQQRRQ